MYMLRLSIVVAVFWCATSLLGVAQDKNKEIKHVPARATSPASGEQMFTSYCASCHGKDAKGNGPAASALNKAPADLTTLAKRNGDKYPDMRVMAVLRGEAPVAAHGTQEMPVWGPVFWHMSQGHPSEVQQRIANLNNYLKSIQGK
jgi:mono/diheme cytochrome c family protein